MGSVVTAETSGNVHVRSIGSKPNSLDNSFNGVENCGYESSLINNGVLYVLSFICPGKPQSR